MIETQKRRRGHNFLPPQAIMRRIPALYATEKTVPEFEDKIIYVHYFSAAWDWYIAELDPATGEAFGYAKSQQGAEWGRIVLPELEKIRAQNGLIIVERDMHFKPRPFKALGLS